MASPLKHGTGGVARSTQTVQPERQAREQSGKRFPAADAAGSPPPLDSLRALDWLNFLLAALLMGFGPFVGLHLAAQGWTPANVGLVLTVSGLVLLCHKRSRVAVSRLRRQQGHRGRRLARATAMLQRRVLMDSGACRSGRSGVATRHEGLAPGRDVCLERAPYRG